MGPARARPLYDAEVAGEDAEKQLMEVERGVSVPQTDTGRRGEYPQALERTVLKELDRLTP